MSYSANQYNHATPLSSAPDLLSDSKPVADLRYFSLHDNNLAGTYKVISVDVGLWGNTLSASDGTLATPFIVSIEEAMTLSAVKIISSSFCYPVDLTVAFYNGSNLLYTANVTGNNSNELLVGTPGTLTITRYVVSITKVSAPGEVAKLYRAISAPVFVRSDTFKVSLSEAYTVTQVTHVVSSDSLKVTSNDAYVNSLLINAFDTVALVESDKAKKSLTNKHIAVSDRMPAKLYDVAHIIKGLNTLYDSTLLKLYETSHIINTIDTTTDIVSTDIAFCDTSCSSHVLNLINVTTDLLSAEAIVEGTLTNIHSVMKSPYRRVFGQVYITYADPMLEAVSNCDMSTVAYNSQPEQLYDNVHKVDNLYFTLYDNDLTGKYAVSDANSQVGWTSKQLSDENGYFNEDVWIAVVFEPRPVKSFIIAFDDTHGNLVRDFNVVLTTSDYAVVNYEYVDNTEQSILVYTDIAEIRSVTVMIHRVEKPFAPATVISLPISSTILYKGYENESNLISIDLLEELTYDDEIEALGGISANEATIVLDNSDRQFFFNNESSLISKQLKRNRKIEPYLGAEITPGEIEWYKLGTFWSYKWNVPVDGLTASVVGFDTIGLLDLTSFTNHQTLINKSIGQLVEYVVEDANASLGFLEYVIEQSLYDIIIPYAWFEPSSHAAALRKISKCFPMHIYCDRDGRICAAPQKLKLDYYYDVWSDSTNVISKTYDSLYTTVPNIINVTVIEPHVVYNESLVSDNYVASVATKPDRTLIFNKPYLEDINIVVDCDDTVEYTYEVFSWGINIAFTGTGVVRHIECFGTAVDVSNTSVITHRDSASVFSNGAITRDVQADFIQTDSLASKLISRLVDLSTTDKYDASVDYRGDISLTINDPILLKDGIAPDNRYNIKRHQLTWDGHLTGSAYLNT